MITKNIIWFFGPSCAGKATTIKKIVNGDYGLYTQILELHPSYKIVKCEESLDKSKPRNGLTSIILNKYNLHDIDILIIKGQTSDLDMETPQSLRKQLTNVSHVIVFLWVSLEELNRRRIATRSGPPWDGWSINIHKDELKIQVQRVDKLKENDFPVFWIDNTGNLPKIVTRDEVILRTEQLNKIG